MDDPVEDCRVCMTPFDTSGLRRPRTLPCGHTFCTACVNGLVQLQAVLCPTCRVSHPVPQCGHFPVSYTIEDMIRRLKEAASQLSSKVDKDSVPSPRATPPASGAGLSKRVQSLVQEQEEKVQEAIGTHQELHKQLDHYQQALRMWGDQVQRLESNVCHHTQCAKALVRYGKAQVEARLKNVQHGEKQLHAVLHTLRGATTGPEAFQAIDDSDHQTEEAKQHVEQCHRDLPDQLALITIKKTSLALQAAMKVMNDSEKEQVAPPPAAAIATATTTLTEKLQAILARYLQPEDLYMPMQPNVSLVTAGHIFATYTAQGLTRHARINLRDGHMYLHCLKRQPLPNGAIMLQLEDVVPKVLPCNVFLDIAWPLSSTTNGSSSNEPQRIIIRLGSDTPMGQQFLLLCTGKLGPTYSGTKFFSVNSKGMPGEYIVGGDYDKNDGTGGTALLSNLSDGHYKKGGKAGTVIPVWCGGDMSVWNTRFGICTRDSEDGLVWTTAFGTVTRGVEVLAAAAQHNPIKEVVVKDCGVVL